MPRTRIVCTLGPATDSDETVCALIRAGMNVARLNFSHGTRAEHATRVERVRRLAAAERAVVALLGDLQGPKIRVGEIPGGHRLLHAGDMMTLTTSAPAHADEIALDFALLATCVQPGDHLLLDDGAMEVVVERTDAPRIVTRVLHGGDLKSRKGVNVPECNLPIPSLTAKDVADVEWALAQDLDYLALSFVRRAEDIEQLRAQLRARGADMPIIAKIEKREAVAAVAAILSAADGVMVARGDLGVELPAEQVPIYQKQIIHQANALGKPVITATQMLESMIHHPQPTRAEASDVANAILDGTDAVMLSAETSIGAYPVAAVQAMARIADFTEKNLHAFLSADREFAGEQLGVADAIGQATVELARQVRAKLIITLTSSGYSSRMVARHRPETPIFAVTARARTRRWLALVWGVNSAQIDEDQQTDAAVNSALRAARDCGLAQSGDRVVITAGVPTGIVGQTNMVQVRSVP